MSPSKSFRSLLVCATLLNLVAIGLYFITRNRLPLEMKLYLNVRHAEFVSDPGWLFEAVAFELVLFAASFGGLYFFWRPARVLYIGFLLTELLVTAILGPRVSLGSVEVINEILCAAMGIILYAMFTSPFRELFEKRAPMKVLANEKENGITS